MSECVCVCVEHWWNAIDNGELKYSEKFVRAASAPNPTWSGLGIMLLSLDERSATIRRRHGAANCGVVSRVIIYLLFNHAVASTEYPVNRDSKMMWTEAALLTMGGNGRNLPGRLRNTSYRIVGVPCRDEMTFYNCLLAFSLHDDKMTQNDTP
jgi:hypothetical protein